MARLSSVLLCVFLVCCSDARDPGVSPRASATASATASTTASAAASRLDGPSPSPVVAPTVRPPQVVSEACGTARAAREVERARIAELRMTIGVATAQRFDAATAAQQACLSDPACAQDGKRLVERYEAVKAAEDALGAEQARLAEEELGLYRADQAVAAACGPE